MHDADAARPALELGPVGEAAERGRKRREDPDPDQIVGRLLDLLAAEHVEQERTRPGTDDDVGQNRMERVAEPRAAEQILRLARLRDEPPNRGLKRPGDGVEDAESLEPPGDRLSWRWSHVRPRAPFPLQNRG